MNVLALDTCFPALSVAVGAGLGTSGATIASRTEAMATGHAERMMPLIRELLAEVGLTMGDINRVAVTIGPGSFTGTRIGVAVARAVKLACNVDIVSFTSLEAIALSPQIDVSPDEDLLVAIDAHRGEAYVQTFEGAARMAVGSPQILRLTDLVSISRGRPLYAVGTAADAAAIAIRADGGTARTREGMIYPDMSAAALAAVTREPTVHAVEPLYLRPPDAKPQEGKSLQRAGS